MKCIVCLFVFSFFLFAEENPFELRKKEILVELDKARVCVEAAKERSELNKCRQQFAQERKLRRDEIKQKRQERNGRQD